MDMDKELVLYAIAQVNRDHGEVGQELQRTGHIFSVVWNLNILSDQECLTDLCFRKAELGRFTHMVVWSGKSERKGYFCDPEKATCLMCQPLWNASEWTDVEKRLGKFASQTYEVFWEMIERFVDLLI